MPVGDGLHVGVIHDEAEVGGVGHAVEPTILTVANAQDQVASAMSRGKPRQTVESSAIVLQDVAQHVSKRHSTAAHVAKLLVGKEHSDFVNAHLPLVDSGDASNPPGPPHVDERVFFGVVRIGMVDRQLMVVLKRAVCDHRRVGSEQSSRVSGIQTVAMLGSVFSLFALPLYP